MNTTNLETFLLLSRLRSFTQTSKELYIAQSTVTNRIADLEKELGQPLFDRNAKALTLTEAGMKFIDYANRILALEKAAVLSINDKAGFQSQIHLGVTNTIYECYLKEALMNFLKTKPATGTKVTIGHSTDLLQLLEEDFLDCTFSYVPLFKPGFLCKSFAIDELILVCSSADTTYSTGIYKKDLKQLRYLYCNFLLQDIGIFVRQLFPPHYQFPFEIDNSSKLVDYVIAGLGYTFLPQSLASPFIKKGLLCTVPLLDFDSPKINNYYIKKVKNHSCDDLLNTI